MIKYLIIFIIIIIVVLFYLLLRGASILNKQADEIDEKQYRKIQGETNGSKN